MKSRQDFRFAKVHFVKSGSVDDDFRLDLSNSVLNLRAVDDVEISMGRSDDLVMPQEIFAEIRTELSVRPDKRIFKGQLPASSSTRLPTVG